MKKLIVLASLLVAITVGAQSKYETAMNTALEQMKGAKTVEEMTKAAAYFERIAGAEKNQWLPFYYASLANYYVGWMDEKADKDVIAEKSKDLLIKAQQIDMNNSELFCLEQMIATMQLVKDPMTRWQSYGKVAASALENAKKADPNNPRIYFLQAQSLMNTPEAFGGGKKVAKPIFEKSVELYKSFKPASSLHPNWGQEEAVKQLEACK